MNKNEVILAVFTALLFFMLFFLFKSVLVYLSVSAVFAIIGSPLVKLFQKIHFKKLKIGKGLASFLTLVSFYSAVTIAMIIVLPYLNREAQHFSTINPYELLDKAQGPIHKVETLILEYTDQNISIEEYVRTKIMSVLNFATISNWINAITNFTGNFLLYFFALSFITFFFLKDGKMLFERFKNIIPNKYREEAPILLPKIKNKLTRYFIGICIEVCIVFLSMSIGLYIADVRYFILIAIVAAVFNVIPYLGPLIGGIFGLLLTSITYCSATPECIMTLLPLLGKTFLVFAIVQVMDNIILQPIIYGKSVNAHPLEIFLVVIICGNLGGIIGMILAIPSWSVIKIVLEEVRKNSLFLKNIYKSNPEQ